MNVEVEMVSTVEMPDRMVHGPGAISRLGNLVREQGTAAEYLDPRRQVLEDIMVVSGSDYASTGAYPAE